MVRRLPVTIIVYSERVSVDLVIQHAMHMRRIILSSVFCVAVPCSSTLSYKRHDVRKTSWNTKCVFSLSLQFRSETFRIQRIIQRDIIKSVRILPVIIARF
jgi:hypothetical protein